MMADPSPVGGVRNSQDTQMRKCLLWNCIFLFPCLCEMVFANFYTLNVCAEHCRKHRKSLAGTLTLLTLKRTLTTRARRRRKTRMKRAGTGPRSRQRGGRGGRAFLKFTSPVSWRAVTWPIKTMRSALPTCPRGSRCVYHSVPQVFTKKPEL